ncbi:MAG: flavodoxin family protein [Candidatus Thorarchaeota archaeon]
MPRALVLYHSLYGNTKAIAISLAKGIEESAIVADCLSIDEVDLSQIKNYDFLAIGGPTHRIGLSKPMKAFLQKLKSANPRGMKGFSFDTRNHSRLNKKRWLMLENSAARRIEGKMKRMKISIIQPRQSAIVFGREGPLESGAEDRFRELGKEIGIILGAEGAQSATSS